MHFVGGIANDTSPLCLTRKTGRRAEQGFEGAKEFMYILSRLTCLCLLSCADLALALAPKKNSRVERMLRAWRGITHIKQNENKLLMEKQFSLGAEIQEHCG